MLVHSTSARNTHVHLRKPAVIFWRRQAEAKWMESPHRACVGRSILYRQEGRNAHTCVPSSLQTGMELSRTRQARRRGGLHGAWHGQERQGGSGRLRDSSKEVIALAGASGQDKCIMVQLSMWPEPVELCVGPELCPTNHVGSFIILSALLGESNGRQCRAGSRL